MRTEYRVATNGELFRVEERGPWTFWRWRAVNWDVCADEALAREWLLQRTKPKPAWYGIGNAHSRGWPPLPKPLPPPPAPPPPPPSDENPGRPATPTRKTR